MVVIKVLPSFRLTRREPKGHRFTFGDPKIEYQIDILNAEASTTSLMADIPDAQKTIVQVDVSKYVNPTFHFEVIGKTSSPAYWWSAELYRITAPEGTVAESEVNGNNTIWERRRRLNISLTGTAEYKVRFGIPSGGTAYLRMARIIVVDSFTNLTTLEEQVENGNVGSRTPATADTWQALLRIRLFRYESAKFSPSPTVSFEATIYTAAGGTAKARLWNVTDGAVVSGSEVSTTNTSPTRVRSGSITLTDAKDYRMEVTNGTDNTTINHTSGKIIFNQSGTIAKTQINKQTSFIIDSGFTTSYQQTNHWVTVTPANLPSNVTYYYEATMIKGIIATSIESGLYQRVEGSLSGSELSESGISLVRKRSGSLTVPEDDYDAEYKITGSAVNPFISGSRIIIDVETPPVVVVKKPDMRITKRPDARSKLVFKRSLKKFFS